MGLSTVNVIIVNEPGAVESSSDAIAGMILSGIAVAGKIALNEPKQIFSLAEAVALGLDEAYDTTNELDVYFQIKQFYNEAKTGKELWIMLVAQTVSMETICDLTSTTNAVKLLDAANGTIRLLGVSRNPQEAYIPVIENGLDDDVWGAMLNAQALSEAYASKMRPFRYVIAGRDWSGVSGALADLRLMTYNRGGIVLCGQGEDIANANIGIVLGRLAADPVQRKISRVKTGPLQLLEAYLTDGKLIEENETALGSIHDKGYIIFRKFEGKTGIYFSSDKTATASSDSFNTIAKGRVIDKAVLLAYLTYVTEIDDDIELNADGTMPASIIKSLQANVEKSINEGMKANGEISSVVCTIDPLQDVSVTDKLSVRLNLIPVGYKTNIEVEIGFNLS